MNEVQAQLLAMQEKSLGLMLQAELAAMKAKWAVLGSEANPSGELKKKLDVFAKKIDELETLIANM